MSVRIAIATDWFAPRQGGIEAQLLQLADRLGGRGNQVDVLTATPDARDGQHFRVRPLRVVAVPFLHLAVSPTLIHTLRDELRRGYDVIHAHVSVVSPVGYAAAAVARALRLPTVVTFHSVLRQKRHLLRAIDAVARIGDGAVAWTAVSELVAGQVREALPTADVCVLPNGLDVAFWGESRSVGRGSRGTVTLVSAMRLHRKKRPMALLRAFAHAVSRARCPARLVLVGEGPERSALMREIQELGLDGGNARVELPGWFPPEELRSVFAAADGFAIASTRESFGIAALEASATGLPVIAMSESGSSEFLSDGVNALLCADDVDFTRALARFIDDARLRARLAANAVPQNRYDWATVLDRHEAAYGRAVSRAAGAGAAAGASA